MKTEEEIAAEKAAAKAAKDAEAARVAAAAEEDEETPPKPVPFKAKGDNMLKELLDEWQEFKLENGWIPKSKRAAPVPTPKPNGDGKPNGDSPKSRNFMTEFWGA